MTLPQLEFFGKIAGIGGLALCVLVLLVRPIIDKSGKLPAAQRAKLFQLTLAGSFAIGALGIIAWYAGAPSARTQGTDSPAIVAGGNVSLGAAPPATPASTRPCAAPGGTATTAGDRSPALVAGCDVTAAPQAATKPP